jgi:hypothetical protein
MAACSMLVGAVEEKGVSGLRIARYGFSPASAWNAYVAVNASQTVQMIDLLSVKEPFDHVCCAALGLLPLSEAQFAFVFEAADGTTQQLGAVDLDAQ